MIEPKYPDLILKIPRKDKSSVKYIVLQIKCVWDKYKLNHISSPFMGEGLPR